MSVLSDIIKVNGRYSQKRIFSLLAFIFALIIGIYIVICDMYLGTKVVNLYAIQVFDGLLIFVATGLGLTTWSGIKQVKQKDE